MRTRLAAIHLDIDQGPFALHNMPCAVCREEPAVFVLHAGFFEPCWTCQELGWTTTNRPKRWWRRGN